MINSIKKRNDMSNTFSRHLFVDRWCFFLLLSFIYVSLLRKKKKEEEGDSSFYFTTQININHRFIIFDINSCDR